MSSGSHLSKDLHDLVKSIGETRSKQEEDKIIIKEVMNLKTKLLEKNIQPKKMKEHLNSSDIHRNVGVHQIHDASFAHIQAVNLTQSKILQLKKMGYLCCSLFLDNDNPLLILLVATLQRDLASTNIHEIVIALTAVSKLISQSFVTALVEPITKLLNHQTDIIRKKSLMVLYKIKLMCPSAISDADYEERMRRSLQDKEPSVMGAALNLYHEELKRGNISKYKNLASNFVAMLKQIIEHKLHKDFDYHRFPAPWYQIKLLQILSILGQNDLKVSEQVYEVLGSTLRRADDTTINIGYAVTYQCVKTISQLYPSQPLLEQAANSVSRFLKSDNNNLKYLGINALISIVGIHPKYVVDHQMTIVDCLESSDDTLKKETLELLFKMTNENNIEVILNKLLMFLKSSSDPTFRKDLFMKISMLNEAHAPTQEWFIRTTNTVFEYGSEFIDNEVLNNYFRLIIDNFRDNGTEFGEFIVDIYMDILRKPNLSDNMVKLIVWVIGEIGSQTYENNAQQLNELTVACIKVLDNVFEDNLTISWTVTALAKLQSSKGFQMFDQARAVFDKYSTSKHLDCQQRSYDYSRLAKYNAALKKSTQINIDKNLSFLNVFVNAELQKGAQPYNNSLSFKAAGLAGTSETSSSQQLHFEPYKDEKYQNKQGASKQSPLEKDDSSGIKVRGPQKWTTDGYKDETPQPPQFKASLPAQTMSIGSSNIAEAKPTPNKPASNMLGISSTAYQSTSNNSNSSGLSITKPLEKKEDPQFKEKQNLANSLFGGMQTVKPTSNISQKKVLNQPAVQPKQNMNLLDFEDAAVKKPQQPHQQQKASDNLFDMSPPMQQKNFIPLKINVETYQNYWETLTKEKSEDMQTRIRSLKDFKEMIAFINIDIVEVISEEIICAGKNANTQNVVLVYGVYHPDGMLSLQLKGADSSDMENIIQMVKKNFQ